MVYFLFPEHFTPMLSLQQIYNLHIQYNVFMYSLIILTCYYHIEHIIFTVIKASTLCYAIYTSSFYPIGLI